MSEQERTFIYSPLSQRIGGDGSYVDVRIYREETDPGWILEVIDEERASTVYGDPFETDQLALDEVLASAQRYGIRVYLEKRLRYEEHESATIH
jgi:hypothetical protein